jgi:hypothetical protein
MSDSRKHRGPHPQDVQCFARSVWPILHQSTADLSWLLTRGYAVPSALKLVGDRFQLTDRQRMAVMRSVCSDQSQMLRQQKQVSGDALHGQRIDLDGFNVLTTVEAALAGGVVLQGRDGCYRDLASMHGSYRKVEETEPALVLVGQVLDELAVDQCHWYLDRPVSNSGRLCTVIRRVAAGHGWPWEASAVGDPDAALAVSPHIIATADSAILDRCSRWLNLAREVIDRRLPDTYLVPMSVNTT